MTADRTLFYPVWISNSGRIGLRWGPPCDTAGGAGRLGKAETDAGRATVSFVVRFQGGIKTPLINYVHPPSARRIVRHWVDLLEATAGEGPPEGAS